MALNGVRSNLWHALHLGPMWRERQEPQAPAGAQVAQLDWEALELSVAACTGCGLCRSRSRTVFGTGAHDAHWMFIGEGPGAEEDARGEPFVGQAGRLLDAMLEAAGLGRDRGGAQAAYIANVVKCRPPGNRNPEAAEVAACAPYLRRQIDLLRPRIIVVMGRFASQLLLASEASVGSLRGRVHEYCDAAQHYPVVVTYHPAYLLRNLADKSKAWADLCLARQTYAGLAGPRPDGAMPAPGGAGAAA